MVTSPGGSDWPTDKERSKCIQRAPGSLTGDSRIPPSSGPTTGIRVLRVVHLCIQRALNTSRIHHHSKTLSAETQEIMLKHTWNVSLLCSVLKYWHSTKRKRWSNMMAGGVTNPAATTAPMLKMHCSMQIFGILPWLDDSLPSVLMCSHSSPSVACKCLLQYHLLSLVKMSTSSRSLLPCSTFPFYL